VELQALTEHQVQVVLQVVAVLQELQVLTELQVQVVLPQMMVQTQEDGYGEQGLPH